MIRLRDGPETATNLGSFESEKLGVDLSSSKIIVEKKTNIRHGVIPGDDLDDRIHFKVFGLVAGNVQIAVSERLALDRQPPPSQANGPAFL
jgi:hypothetical protein